MGKWKCSFNQNSTLKDWRNMFLLGRKVFEPWPPGQDCTKEHLELLCDCSPVQLSVLTCQLPPSALLTKGRCPQIILMGSSYIYFWLFCGYFFITLVKPDGNKEQHFPVNPIITGGSHPLHKQLKFCFARILGTVSALTLCRQYRHVVKWIPCSFLLDWQTT